jgi:hypothetical protein
MSFSSFSCKLELYQGLISSVIDKCVVTTSRIRVELYKFQLRLAGSSCGAGRSTVDLRYGIPYITYQIFRSIYQATLFGDHLCAKFLGYGRYSSFRIRYVTAPADLRLMPAAGLLTHRVAFCIPLNDCLLL